MTKGALVYAAAVAIGVAAVLLVLPLEVLWGAGAGWHPPGPDQAQSLAGHLAFQADAWRWPLLETRRLFWPNGISLALVDSNALMSLLAKLWTRTTGQAPENWLGAFIGACWVLQPVAAAYAARGLRVGVAAALAAAVLAVAWPALMFRMMHLNLCAHFLILVALGLAFRGLERTPGRGWWVAAGALLVGSVLTHPYLFELCAAVLAAVPLHAAIWRRAGWKLEAGLYVTSGVLAVAVLMVLSGPLGGGDKGFTFFSMNLVSPVWPQRSGVFGAGLPIVDATGGQYEGFNWLGAGTMLLLVGAGVWAGVRRRAPRPALALALVLGGLFVLSLSSRVYAGPVKLLDLGDKPWEDIFGSFRSAGRAFWPVGYALMLGAVAAVDRMPRRLSGALLAAAVIVQVVDIRPLLADARAGWVNGSGIVVPLVPERTRLFTVAPHPGCAKETATKWGGPVMLLEAVRDGARTGDIGLGRSPKWFSCERILADALELPLLAWESRAFFGTGAQAALRPALLGAGSTCRRQRDVVVCAAAGMAVEGEAVAPATMLPALAVPMVLQGGELGPVLGFGWTPGADGVVWSEGPLSSLLIPVPAGQALTLRLHAAGVGFRPGEERAVSVSAGRVSAGGFSLPDGVMTEVTVAVPAEATVFGVLRVALGVTRPVDPARRGIVAPVRRAAIVLQGIRVDVDRGTDGVLP